MSNNDKTKFDADDEYDAIFANSDDTSSPVTSLATDKSEKVVPKTGEGQNTDDLPNEILDVLEAPASFSSTVNNKIVENDDDEAALVDIEDGIFADTPPPKKSRNAAGILGAVAVLAVVGAGGFVYVANPEIVEQIGQNISGEAVPEPTLPTVPPVQNAENGGGKVVEASEPVSTSAPAPAPTPTPTEVSTAPAAAPVLDGQPEKAAPDQNVTVAAAPVPDPASVPVAVPTEAATATPVSAPVVPTPDNAALSSPAPAPSATAPVGEEKVAVKTDVKKEAKVADKKEKIAVSAEEKKRIADEKLDQYFDSPSGKILKSIPAPSMDPRKGSQESIIVVNKKPASSATVEQKARSHTEPRTGAHGRKAGVSIQTTDIDAKLISADRALKLQRLDAAREMYDELYRINPHDERVLMGRAVLMQKTGDTASAVAAYEDVLAEYPGNTQAIINLAGLIRQVSPAVALEKLLDLNQQYPGKSVVLAQLGVAYADAGNYADAYKSLERAASLDPNNPQHYYNMAVVSEKAGDVPLAIRNYEKALEVDAIYGDGQRAVSREKIYDRLSTIRGN